MSEDSHDPVAYKAQQLTKLARMSGQIADFFRSYPEEQAIPAISGHINEFWPRRMREDFVAGFEATSPELQPLVGKALAGIHSSKNRG